MLGILERYFDLDLALGDWRSQLKDNGQFREPVFKAAARMPLTWMAVGVPANGFPFDVSAFIEEVRKESGSV
jgi:hypothetical protein